MKTIGFILIAVVVLLYVWWLKYTRGQKGVSAKESTGIQVFDILVKGVYSPNVIRAKVGRPVRINFIRKEDNECSRFVVFSDFKIRKELPEGEVVPVEFMPDRPGEFSFTCDMSMYRGKLIVE